MDKVTHGSVADIVHSFVQIGVEDPHHYDQASDCDLGEPLNSWFTRYRWEYNTAVWEIIMSRDGLLLNMRRVLLADLKVTDNHLGQEWGNIVLHAYGRALLDYFLQRKAPAWCITTSWQTPELMDKLKTDQQRRMSA